MSQTAYRELPGFAGNKKSQIQVTETLNGLKDNELQSGNLASLEARFQLTLNCFPESIRDRASLPYSESAVSCSPLSQDPVQ
jgi:hypothetical protein